MGLGTRDTRRAARPQSSRPRAVAKPFNNRARKVYQNILQSRYEDELAKILANTQKKEDCREIARLFLVGGHRGKLARLSNISEEEERKVGKSRIQEVLSNFQAIQDETDTLHLFISAPLDDEERGLREEQFEVYAGKNPFVTSAPGKEDSNAVLIKVERRWTPGTVISSFIKKASKLPDVKQLSIVVNGHGGRQGTVLLAGQNGRKEEVANDEIIRSINETLTGGKQCQWPLITLVLAQCYAHKFDQEAASDMDFNIVWFTTNEKPETTNRPAIGIRNKWHHKQLDTYGESLKTTIFSLEDKRREAEKSRDDENASKRKQEKEEQALRLKLFKVERKLRKQQRKQNRSCFVGPVSLVFVLAFTILMGLACTDKFKKSWDITEEIPNLAISLPDIDFQPIISANYFGSLLETLGGKSQFFYMLHDWSIRPLISDHLNNLLLHENVFGNLYKTAYEQSFKVLRLKDKASNILLHHSNVKLASKIFRDVAELEKSNTQQKEIVEMNISCLQSQYRAIISVLETNTFLNHNTVELINAEMYHGSQCLKQAGQKAEELTDHLRLHFQI